MPYYGTAVAVIITVKHTHMHAHTHRPHQRRTFSLSNATTREGISQLNGKRGDRQSVQKQTCTCTHCPPQHVILTVPPDGARTQFPQEHTSDKSALRWNLEASAMSNEVIRD